MADPLAVFNGRLVPASALSLPITDGGVAHGAIITDVCRTYGGRLFRHADHLERFVRDCAACFIPLAFTPEQIAGWAALLVERNAASGELTLNTLATPQTLILRTTPLDQERYRPYFTDGIALWPTPPHPASALLPPTVKHRNRLHWYVAERLAPPGSLPLTTDERGHLLETGVGNLLLVRGGVVLSPPRGSVLPGVSLKVVRELCDAGGIAFREQPLTADADEAMLCGTGFGLAGVRAIGERQYPWPGPLTRRLMAAWAALHTPSVNPTEPTA